jgi:hypothetical protein
MMIAYYMACSKPWQCKLKFPEAWEEEVYPTNATCKFHGFSKNLEEKLATIIVGESAAATIGGYYPEYFLGYCNKEDGYQRMKSLPDDFEMHKLYGF